MEHLFTQDGLDKLAEIFVYLDLLSSIVAMIVLYEKWEIDAEARERKIIELQQLEARFAEIEQRLQQAEKSNAQLYSLLLELQKQIIS